MYVKPTDLPDRTTYDRLHTRMDELERVLLDMRRDNARLEGKIWWAELLARRREG